MKTPCSTGLAIILALVSSTCLGSPVGDVSFLQKGMKIPQAHKLMAQHRWKSNSPHRRVSERMSMAEVKLFRMGIRSIDSCAVDAPVCVFLYKKNGECLKIFTAGEEVPQMRVDYWIRGCD